MRYVKQSTLATIHVGPFVDATDGFTPETGLAAGTVDEIGVYKNAGTALVDISGTTAFTHRAGGMYTVTLSTSDTDTLGHLIVYVRDDSVCRPIAIELTVLPAKVYNSLIAGSDNLEVDTIQWNGTAVTVDGTTSLPKVDIAGISGDATAADNLESYCDGTTPIPSNATQISGDATAANNLESDYDNTGYNKANSTIGVCTLLTDIDTAAKASINTEVDNALDTAIPASPTANSINERVKAIDVLTEASGDGDLAAILADTGTDGVLLDLTQLYPQTPTDKSIGQAFQLARSIKNAISISGTTLTVKKDDGTTTLYTQTLDASTNPTALT